MTFAERKELLARKFIFSKKGLRNEGEMKVFSDKLNQLDPGSFLASSHLRTHPDLENVNSEWETCLELMK